MGPIGVTGYWLSDREQLELEALETGGATSDSLGRGAELVGAGARGPSGGAGGSPREERSGGS